MRWTRGIVAGLAALVGVGAALAVLPGRAAALRPHDGCILGCPGTTSTTTSTTTPTPPSAGPVTVSNLTPTSATFAATYDTGSGNSAYQFAFVSGDESGTTPQTTVAGGSPPSTVSAQTTQLEPNAQYTVQLVWSGPDAIDGAPPYGGPITKFTTPMLAPARANVTADRRAVVLGQSVTLTASATSDPDGTVASLQDSAAPYRSFRLLESTPARTVLNADGSGTLVAQPARNEEVRVTLSGAGPDDHQVQPPSTSAPVFIYVFPSQGLDLSRPHNSTVVQATATFGVHPLRRGFRGEPVYFYRSSRRHGRAQLIGHAGLRVSRMTASALTASVFFSDPGNDYIVSCVRHAVLPDMGIPFTDRACGRPTLRV